MKNTALYNEHVKLNAKIVPFAGWNMPLQYTGIIDEHNTVRSTAGIFDVSHMGQVFVDGKDSEAFLQSIVPQDVATLPVNKAVYTQMTNKEGGILDDLIIYRLEDENGSKKFFIVINASMIESDVKWMQENAVNFDVNVKNSSSEYSMIAVQGPCAKDIINDAGLSYENQPKYFYITEAKLLNTDAYIARTGYTGEDGFEIVIKNEYASTIWQNLLKLGEKHNAKPVGLGARDTLRLEAGMPLYGQDMTENETPIEAGLGWSVNKNKNIDYNGKNVIMSQLETGVSKRLVAFKMIDRAIPRHEYEVVFDGKTIGKVTSGGVSPSTGNNIGLAYIEKNLKVDDEFFIKVRNKEAKAVIVKLPFIKKTKIK